jgi:photosystem II stability/assembly factor-like uncharacterized protein
MRRKLFILTILVAMIVAQVNISHGQSGWIQQNSGTTAFLYSVFFTDVNTGFIIADSNIFLKTTNGGTNWIRKNLEFTNARLERIYFISPQTGWLYGYRGIVIKTTNGGNNWFYQLNQIYDDYVTGIFFISEMTGWAVGTSRPAILKTTNGGQNWSVLDSAKYSTFVHFISSNTGFAGGCWGRIFKTTNGGNNWYMVEDGQISNRRLHSVTFPSDSIGWIVGEGFIYKTSNSGENWISDYYVHEGANTVFFVNVLTGWRAGYNNYSGGKIFKTTNSGNNWIEQYSADSFYFYSSSFVNLNTGWIVGSKGTILRTTNGGEPIGIKQIRSEVPVSFVLYQNYPNPFNPVTKIKFSIPLSKGARGMNTKLVVYDVLGREVASLIPPLGGGEEGLKPGTYEAVWDAVNYPSGVYFYKLMTDSFSETKKMVLMK